MKISEIISKLEKFAPPSLQESYDNSGLLVGDKNNEVTSVLLTLDITEDVVEEAKSKNCNLYYEPRALCYHYQFDDITSLSKRYWRYSYYGAGLKKLTLTRLIRLILRQTKVLFYWMYRDLLKKNYHFLNINLIMSYYFIILCINEYLLNEKK